MPMVWINDLVEGRKDIRTNGRTKTSLWSEKNYPQIDKQMYWETNKRKGRKKLRQVKGVNERGKMRGKFYCIPNDVRNGVIRGVE